MYDPKTYLSSLQCCALIGVFLFSLLTEFIHSRMSPSPVEAFAVNWVLFERINRMLRDSAARVIQLHWRHRHADANVLSQCPNNDLFVLRFRKKYVRQFLAASRQFRYWTKYYS